MAICLASIGYLLGEYGITFPFELEVSLYATLFYMIGYVCKDALVKVKEKWIAIVALLLTNIILSIILPRTDMAVNQCGWYGLNAGNALVGTMAFFLLAKKMEKWDAKNIVRRFLTWAGNNTIIVLGLSQVLNLHHKGLYGLPSSVECNQLTVATFIVMVCIVGIINTDKQICTRVNR